MPKGYPQSFKDSSRRASRRHISLYRVTLVDGDIYRFAHSDDDIIAKIGGTDFLFQAFGHRRTTASVHMNLQVDTMDITVPNAILVTEGQKKRLSEFALTGLLDKATIDIFVWDGDNPNVNAVLHSSWIVQGASVNRQRVVLRCESQTAMIDKETPRTLYQELCNNELYSTWCGVNRASFEITTTFFGISPAFEDAFERSVLTSLWTELHFVGGSVSLDGDDVDVIATASGADKDFSGTADTGSLIHRTSPTAPLLIDVEVANWKTISDAGSTHTFLMLRESTAAGSRFFAIQSSGNDTQIRTIQRTTTGGVASTSGTNFTVNKTSGLRLRIWYNGTTVLALYSQDNGATWIVMEALQMASLGGIVGLCDEWLSAFSSTTTPGTKYDDYKEWTGNIGPLDILPFAQSVGVVFLNGSQITDKYYDLGELTITSGKNNGLKRAVKSHDHINSNLARGRSYVYSEAPTSVTDSQLFILTNSVEPLVDETAGEHVRWGTAQADPVDVTVDLGASYNLDQFIGTFEDQKGEFDATRKPTSVEFFTSPDNVVFTSRGTVLAAAATRVHGGWFQFRYALTITPVAARYVRFRIDRVASSLTTCSELVVNTFTYQEQLTLLHDLPFIPSSGDGAKIAPGCDKRLSTCKNKFNNLVPAGGQGFRGFPTIPRPTDSL